MMYKSGDLVYITLYDIQYEGEIICEEVNHGVRYRVQYYDEVGRIYKYDGADYHMLRPRSMTTTTRPSIIYINFKYNINDYVEYLHNATGVIVNRKIQYGKIFYDIQCQNRLDADIDEDVIKHKLMAPYEPSNINWPTAAMGVCESNKKNMTLKEKFTQVFLKEPEKSFRKNGITNGDGILTQEGQAIFLTWLLGKNGEDFKKEVVDEIAKDENCDCQK